MGLVALVVARVVLVARVVVVAHVVLVARGVVARVVLVGWPGFAKALVAL